MTMAYCVRDKKMVEVKNGKTVKTKTGRSRIAGVCPHCGTKVSVFI